MDMSKCCVLLTMPALFITLSVPRKMFIKKVPHSTVHETLYIYIYIRCLSITIIADDT
jgi:hypothetical protein